MGLFLPDLGAGLAWALPWTGCSTAVKKRYWSHNLRVRAKEEATPQPNTASATLKSLAVPSDRLGTEARGCPPGLTCDHSWRDLDAQALGAGGGVSLSITRVYVGTPLSYM